MGSNEGDGDEKPVHQITVGSFYLAPYEVTNEEYCRFLNAKGKQKEGNVEWINLAGRWEGEKCRIRQSNSIFTVEPGYEKFPVIFVSWYGAKAYCDWVSSFTGMKYRLPTESEWEYAAGNGRKHTKYSWGDGLPTGKNGGNVADETARKKFTNWPIFEGYSDDYIYAAPVGSFEPNELGLYDMSGNVWEWCADSYGAYLSSGSNVAELVQGSKRVCRGGSWNGYPNFCRSTYRDYNPPNYMDSNLGFRIARTP